MAQTSVPTALLPSDDLSTQTSGVTLDSEVVSDPTGNPLESDVGSNTEIERLGTATSLVDAVDDTSEAKFFRLYNDLETPAEDNSVAMSIAYSGQTLSDPGVDINHNILLLIRRNGAAPDGPENITFGLYSFDDLQNPVYFNDITGLVPQDTFALITIPLSAPEVQDFRSKNGYLAGPAFFATLSASNDDPDVPLTSTWDFAYIALEVPDAGPSPDLELTGNVTIDIDASEDGPDVIVDIDASSVYQLSDIIANITVELDASSQYGQNEIDGNVTVDIDASAVIVLSVDPSGIYTLVPGRKFDTLYNRIDEDDVDTIDVAIPRPFFKTAFIGG